MRTNFVKQTVEVAAPTLLVLGQGVFAFGDVPDKSMVKAVGGPAKGHAKMVAYPFVEPEQSDRFLAALYKAVEQGQENAAMRMIYSNLYQFRMVQAFGVCDRILHDVDVNRLEPSLLISFLTITAPVKTLANRASFYARAKEAITRLRGESATKRILIGLE